MFIRERVPQKGAAAGLLAFVFLLTACGTGTDTVVGPNATLPDLPVLADGSSGDGSSVGIELCKLTPDTAEPTWADFEIFAPIGDFPLGDALRLYASDVFPGGCAFVWLPSAGLGADDAVTVTISEVAMTAGMTLEVISVIQPGVERVDYRDRNTVNVNVTGTYGARVIFKNSGTPVVEPPDDPQGGAGCTPGFWRQEHHHQYWTNYDPTDTWGSVFGDPGSHQAPGRFGATFNSSTTLGTAVGLNGGEVFALARHAVAALLNAASPEVSYDLTVSGVVSVVNDALASGNYESAKDLLQGYNEQGCTVDKSN